MHGQNRHAVALARDPLPTKHVQLDAASWEVLGQGRLVARERLLRQELMDLDIQQSTQEYFNILKNSLAASEQTGIPK